MWSQTTYPPCSWFHLYCWESILSNRWGQSHGRVKGRGRTSTLVRTLHVAHWGEAPVVGRTGFLFAKGYWWPIRSMEASALELRGGVGTVAEGWTLLSSLSKSAEFNSVAFCERGVLILVFFFLSSLLSVPPLSFPFFPNHPNRDTSKGDQVSQNGLPAEQGSPRVSYRSQTYQNYKNFNSRRTASDHSWSGLWSSLPFVKNHSFHILLVLTFWLPCHPKC